MSVTDELGRTVASRTLKDCVVPSGTSFDLVLDWADRLGDGAYIVTLLVSDRGQVIGAASTRIRIAKGVVLDVGIPVGKNVVEVTVGNPGPEALSGSLSVIVRDKGTGDAVTLPAQTVTVPPASSQTVAFPWQPDDSASGQYHVTATIAMADKTYGADSESSSTDVDIDLVTDPE